MDRVALENDWVMLNALRELLEMVVPRERLAGRGLIEQLTSRMQATAEALAVCSPEPIAVTTRYISATLVPAEVATE